MLYGGKHGGAGMSLHEAGAAADEDLRSYVDAHAEPAVASAASRAPADMLTGRVRSAARDARFRQPGACADLAGPARAGILVLIAAAGLLCGAAEGALGQTLVTHRIPAALAMEAVEAAVATCTQQGYGVTATVIDVDAERIAMLRGDTAGAHTFEASWGKAYTAVGFAPIFKLNSGGELAARIAQFAARQPPGTLPFQPPEGMIFRAGGLTIKLGEEVIGAIGVGGAPSAEADEACARAGLDKIRDRIR